MSAIAYSTIPRSVRKFFVLIGVVFPMFQSANAATLIQSFDNFNLSGTYERWADGNFTTLTSGAESYTVESRGFGGGFFDINPTINAAGETQIALDVTVDAAGTLPGVILALVDADGTLQNYAWYSLTDGAHLLTQTIGVTSFGGDPGTIPGMDLSKLDFFHIQVDGQQPYKVSFNNLELTKPVPEPSAFSLLVIGWCVARRNQRSGVRRKADGI
jgi:hypothetical protein